MDSPFNKSTITARSPPPTPTPSPTARSFEDEEARNGKETSDIQSWITAIDQHLNEICTIAYEGKLNSDQKQKISKLCLGVSHGISQMAVQYQSVRQNALLLKAKIQALNEKSEVTKSLQEIKTAVLESSSKPQMNQPSFADMVKKSPDNFVRPTTINSVAIYPSDKLQTSDSTKTLIQKLICPDQMKLQVRGVRKTRNGGVIISTETKDDVEKLKKSSLLTSSGFTVEEPSKRNPRVTIIGVPSTLSEKELFDCLYDQNLGENFPNMTKESLMSLVKLSHKSGKKDAPTCNYIVEVSAHIRKTLITQQRVYINWSSYPVRDFTLVTRCFKCQQYGHAAKYCKETTSTCGQCGVIGHATSECTKKNDAPKCATCCRFKKPCEHKTGDISCPARKIAESRYINSIDYVGA